MDKKQLLEFIQNLPDDVEAIPADYRVSQQKEGPWESQGRKTHIGGVYRQTVDNKLSIHLRFTTQFEGEFRRTYENDEGEFLNIKRVQ
jgi:hypothetical protein